MLLSNAEFLKNRIQNIFGCDLACDAAMSFAKKEAHISARLKPKLIFTQVRAILSKRCLQNRPFYFQPLTH
jgi:hypothetical protein